MNVLKKELYIAVRQTALTTQKKEQYLEISQIVSLLAEQISAQTYQPSAYTCFAISDPTPREILAPSYSDRIVHRWLINKMEPYIDKRMLSCSYANRKGKGHHKAVKQLQYYLNNPINKYYLKMDIESYFNSVDHATLLVLLERWISKLPYKENERTIIASVAKAIVTHNPTQNVFYTGNKEKLKIIPRHKSYFYNAPGKGLPLGNLSSQFFANIYLHELDWFVKNKLPSPLSSGRGGGGEVGGRYYLRYVDDTVLLAETIEQLKEWKEKISNFLKEELKLTPHPKKTILQPTRYGIDFLGYIVKRKNILVRKRVVKNFKRKLYFYNYLLEPEKYPFRQMNGNGSIEKMYRNGKLKAPIMSAPALSKNILSSINSYFGIFAKADTYRLRKSLYLNRFGNLQKMFYANNSFQKTGLMRKYQNLQHNSLAFVGVLKYLQKNAFIDIIHTANE
ncbi:MAG: hypothetical protein A3F72_08150 [Bacteroidetes bacterium RIFCSPLOWO2_12_FULL_35_15]|nr:MAG: hypothetical protein A3F72_08150 [Bacteroidetes bacterium RIFCSPLOWO2_12_FULL_35_15]